MSSISKEEILKVQNAWADSIIDLSRRFKEKTDFEAPAEKLVDDLYDYQNGPVLFKPTKAALEPFRETREKALSYFIGKNGVCSEDLGFAILDWVEISFKNHQIVLQKQTAWAMGHYFFKNSQGETTQVEYTFGYRRGEDQKIKIFLHHSSIPFQS